jgi:hypothetical protein
MQGKVEGIELWGLGHDGCTPGCGARRAGGATSRESAGLRQVLCDAQGFQLGLINVNDLVNQVEYIDLGQTLVNLSCHLEN